MKTFLFVLTALFCIAACSDDDLSPDLMNLLDDIPADAYAQTDALSASFTGINGTWRVTGTGGGFTGAGYTQDFDHLLLKANQIYGIVRDGELIDFGQVEVNAQGSSHSESPRLTFVSKMNSGVSVEMTVGTNYGFLNDDGTLTIGFAAADGFDTYFERE